jgi:hypothetical protein
MKSSDYGVLKRPRQKSDKRA